MTKNEIAVLNGLVIVPEGSSDNDQLAASLQAELMNLGFILTPDAYKACCLASKEWITAFYEEIVPLLKKKLGADRHYKAFYRNFPKQVMEMSDLELFLNAICHYWSGGKWEPDYKLQKRGIAFENTKWKKIDLGNEASFRNIFTRLCSINQSLTETDKETIGWFTDYYKEGIVLPPVIPFKETLCILASKGFDVPVKTVTDVLRVAVYMSGGDISLPSIPRASVVQRKTKGKGVLRQRLWTGYFLKSMQDARDQEREKFKFKKFSRAQRRMILGLLEKTNLDLPEMQSRYGRWLRLGEVLHPGEYKDKFPKTHMAFVALRNQNEKNRIRTYHGQVDLAFEKDWKKGVELLAVRPGEFARKLDWMLRSFDPEFVLSKFVMIGDKISSKVLFELFNHFHARSNPEQTRSIMIKGKKAKMKVLDPLPPMDKKLVSKVKDSIMSIIRKKVSTLPSLGPVWIDERLAKVPLPFAMRSVNASIKTYIRGTRVPFDKTAKVIRAFIHWFDKDGSIDLDLSASLHNEELNSVSHISFTNLREHRFNCCHSGDIRHRKGACAEYVDISIKDCLDGGVRYVFVQVYNYNGGAMHEVKDCVFGLMEREHPEANKIFVPKTISNCCQLANESPSVFICILDLKEREYIWVDMETERYGFYENNRQTGGDMLKSIVSVEKMSVYDLLKLHVEGRGKLVFDKNEAKKCLNWEDFVTSYAEIATYMTF